MGSAGRRNQRLAELIEGQEWKRREVVDKVNAAYEQMTGKPGAYDEEAFDGSSVALLGGLLRATGGPWNRPSASRLRNWVSTTLVRQE